MLNSDFSLLPTQEPRDTENISDDSKNQSGWLSGAVKGFSEAFSSFSAKFKTSGSSIFGHSKSSPAEGTGQKSMFSSVRDWGSSFSLRDWIPKGISFDFGNKNNGSVTTRDSLAPKTSLLDMLSVRTVQYNAKAAHEALNDPSQWQTD